MRSRGIVILAVFTAFGCSSAQKTTTPVSEKKPEAKATTQAPAKPEATAPAAKTAKSEPKSENAAVEMINCESGADKRALEIKKKGGGCEVIYTKQGAPASVANSQAGTAYCEKTVEKIKDHLQQAGFKCAK